MKHDIRIVALDLDGTLLDSAKRLSEANRAALAEAAAKGVQIVPTTGRFFGMMPECIRDLPFIAIFSLPISFLETTETTCKNNLFFLAAQPRGALETGRGCARIPKVVFTRC